MTELAGAVLTGGASRRMGRDKALVEVDGIPMARRVADALVAAGCRPVIAVGGDGGALTGLGLRTVADRFPGEGPIGAILTALDATRLPTVVVATDLARLDASALAALVDPSTWTHVSRTDERDGSDGSVGRRVPDVVMARTDRLEPLCALWWPSAAAELERCFEAGERAVHRCLEHLDVVEVVLPAAALANLNTPRDLGPRA